MRLSTIAIAACMLAMSANASDLADAFKNGKVTGEIKTMYTSTNDNDGAGTRSDVSGFAVGGELGFTTADFYGFKFGTTVQTSHRMGMQDEDASKNDTRLSITNTNMTQAYLQYNIDEKNSIKVGRQFIQSPLIFSSPYAFMQKDSFEGYFFKTKAIKDTVIWGGALTKYFQRDAGVSDSDTINFHDPIYNLFVKNKSIKGLTLTAQALYMNGDNTLLSTGGPHPIKEQNFLYTFANVDYKLPVSIPATIRSSYYDLNYDTATDADEYIIGGTLGLGNFKFQLDYGKVSDEAATLGTIGDIPTLNPLLMQINDASFAGMEAYVAKLDVNMAGFGIKGFKRLRLAHGHYESDTIGREVQETTIDVINNFSGPLKGLMTRTRFSNAHFDKNRGVSEDENQQEFRFLAVYKF